MKTVIIFVLLQFCCTMKAEVDIPSQPEKVEYGVFDDVLSWNSAIRSCAKKGGKLAAIHDVFSQINVIMAIAEHGNGDHSEKFWFDATDRRREGIWTTFSGKRLQFENWADDEPTDNEVDDCGVILSDANYRWGADKCNTHHGYVCEFQQDTSYSPSPGVCLTGWNKIGSSCYRIELEARSWHLARRRCLAVNSDLAQIIPSIGKQAYEMFGSRSGLNILQALGVSQGFWIGLHKDPAGDFTWANGAMLNDSMWLPGEPNNVDFNEHCGELVVGGHIFGWNDVDCRNLRPFMCEQVALATPPRDNDIEEDR